MLFFSSRRRHTRCALVTGVQTCALPICSNARSDLQKETSEQQELITMQLRRAAIVSPLRTPVGKFGGGLSSLTAGELGATILKAIVERSGIDTERVDDVVFGHGYPSGEATSIGRWSWLAAGLPPTVRGVQLDPHCGSGPQAIIVAAMLVQTGAAAVRVAGGAESLATVEHYSPQPRI